MLKKQQSSEQGQVLILIVLGLVVFLGFVALAVDGGMVYSDRRRAQNAADASSLGGGRAAAVTLDNEFITYLNWDCSGNVYNALAAGELAAVNSATSNDYTIDYDLSDKNGVDAVCGEEDTGSWLDKYIDVHTMITADTQTSFAHFVFSGPLRNSVEAITRIRPRAPMAYGNAIVALREDCPNTNTGGVHFDGTSDLSVTGGGIFSNACMKANGNINVDVYGGSNITCTGEDCLTTNGHPSLDPHEGVIQEGTTKLPPAAYEVPPPDCSGLPNEGGYSGSGTISPGRYSGITLNSHDAVVMQPGLYCVSGNFRVSANTTLQGNGVTIYLTSGDFLTTGGATVQLTAPPATNCTYCPPPIPGMLIYLAEGNTGEVSLMGTSDSEYLGVVYAPNGMIEAGGTGSELSEIHAQLIGDTVKLHGTTSVVINFIGEENHQIPPRLELFK